MKTRVLAVLVGVLTAIAAVALQPTAGASPAAAKPSSPVYWINLAGTASQHPDSVYFTASAGGYMEDITWKSWGKHRTVGRGTFGTSAPCGGDMPACPEGPAKIVMKKPVKCTPKFGSKKGKRVRVYRHATLTYPDGAGGTTTTDITDRAGWASCKQSR